MVKESGGLPQPGAGGHNDIRAADGVNRLRRPQSPQMPQVVRMIVRHRVRPPVGCHHRRPGQFGQPGNLGIGHTPFHAAPGQNDRTLRRQDFPRCRFNLLPVAPRFALPGAVGRRRQQLQRHLGAGQQIPGNIHQHRPHLA